jgi:hypothetical protein
MSDGTFEKVSRSDKTLYGPRKLLLCGFAAGMQANFAKVLEVTGLGDLDVVWVTAEQADTEIGQLVEMPPGTGAGNDSALPRAIIVAGIRENELHNLMNTCRASGMKQALWAVMTPVSEKWTLRQLLVELEAERTALQEQS